MNYFGKNIPCLLPPDFSPFTTWYGEFLEVSNQEREGRE